MKSSYSFIIPHNTLSSYKRSFLVNNKLSAVPREVYDISTFTTFMAFVFAKYWKYPDPRIQRRDVELFGYMMALVWQSTTNHDPSVYLYLWFVGFACFLYSKIFLGFGNMDNANNAYVGVEFGGRFVSMLFIIDLYEKFTDAFL